MLSKYFRMCSSLMWNLWMFCSICRASSRRAFSASRTFSRCIMDGAAFPVSMSSSNFAILDSVSFSWVRMLFSFRSLPAFLRLYFS